MWVILTSFRGKPIAVDHKAICDMQLNHTGVQTDLTMTFPILEDGCLRDMYSVMGTLEEVAAEINRQVYSSPLTEASRTP